MIRKEELRQLCNEEAKNVASKVGFADWYSQAKKFLTEEEKKEVNAVWNAMSGSSCWNDAFLKWYETDHWSPERVKRELPQVQVKVGSKIVTGRISGRLNKFATVTVDNDTPRRGMPNWYDFQAAWETLAHCLNLNEPVAYSPG